MTDKSYLLSDSQRIIIHDALNHVIKNGLFRPGYAPEFAEVFAMFQTEHPVDPEIVGRRAILDYMHERGFKGRENEAMMSFTWGPGEPTWARIITKLNQDNPVHEMLRAPNVGSLTVKSVMLRCIAHGWIRDPVARRNVDRWLGEIADAADFAKLRSAK